jgi:hypothetical protein
MNTIKNPLELKYNGHSYKVNKPGDMEGKYVDKYIAEQLRMALEQAYLELEYHNDHQSTAGLMIKRVLNETL